MDDRPGFIEWFVAGLGFGIGVSVAGAALSAAAWLLFMQQAEELIEEMQPTQYRTIQREIAPMSKEKCLERSRSGGVANERYKRCRTGYSYRERIPVN
ncbi:hypothetical protein [Algiphilus aromaticivorans]|uniref:hypothetical protein n=1 Tax=Algiphilus aromaticivorans TaxID=382454 RepID=UPI0005C1924C|nr:hypothetical protein [Algiphilus aromaticivorans]